MAHVRLAVIDPANGQQPMTNTDGSVHVIFNGRYITICQSVRTSSLRGTHKSRCDTEVLIHLWQEKRESLLDELIKCSYFYLGLGDVDRHAGPRWQGLNLAT